MGQLLSCGDAGGSGGGPWGPRYFNVALFIVNDDS